MTTTIAIHGAAGRMGRRLVALASEHNQLQLASAIEQPQSPFAGHDAGELAGVGSLGVKIADQLAGQVGCMIDFTVAPATRKAIAMCVQTGSNLVIGTTGLTDEDQQAIDHAAKTIAILQAPNMSLGVNLLFALAGQVASKLGDDYDIEIVETHHRHKQDAPSGTALGIAKAICDATSKDLDTTLVHGREGGDVKRKPGQIGMHALRTGDVVGRHTASFGTLGEELQLTHIATHRDIFARGALTAARWLAQKSAGRYHMADVLGL